MSTVFLGQVSNAEVEETKGFDKCSGAEQLLSLKRLAPDLIAQKPIKKCKIDNESKKSQGKPKKESNCRLLPIHATAILKEWILSPEHFAFPYPTEVEKEMLMEKTGINRKQLKYWFTNARRRLWKEKFIEQQKQNSNTLSPEELSKINAASTSLLSKGNVTGIHRPPLFNNMPFPDTAVKNTQVAQLNQQMILRRLAPTPLITTAFPNSASTSCHDSIRNLQHVIAMRNYNNSRNNNFIKRSFPENSLPNQFYQV